VATRESNGNSREVPGKSKTGNISAICSTLFPFRPAGMFGFSRSGDPKVFKLLRQLKVQVLDRVRQMPWLEMCITLCHDLAAVAQDFCDSIEVNAGLHHPRCGCVSEVMEPDMSDICPECGNPEGIPEPPSGSLDQDMWDALFMHLPSGGEYVKHGVTDWYISGFVGFC